ncbi:hypothetical protein MKW98_032625, partial [Papaver atlanticum]
GGESGKTFTDKCSRQGSNTTASISGIPSKYEDDASPVDSLSDYHTDEFDEDDDESDDKSSDDDDWENQNIMKKITDCEWD